MLTVLMVLMLRSFKLFVYTAADLEAGADITDAIIGVVPAGYAATVIDAQVISTGAAAGIDAENTSVVLLEVGSTKNCGSYF